MSFIIPIPKIGEKLVCPICKKTFKVTEDSKYICCGGYTCSLKCFLRHIKKEDITELEEETTDLSTEETASNELQKADENELFGIIE